MAQTAPVLDRGRFAAEILQRTSAIGNDLHGYREKYTEKMADRDAGLFLEFVSAYAAIEGPRLGDFVKWPDGTYSRFSHDWGDSLQTSREGCCSFYVHKSGGVSFSGSLDRAKPLERFKRTEATALGWCWTFSGDYAGAGRAVYAQLPWRVYEYTE